MVPPGCGTRKVPRTAVAASGPEAVVKPSSAAAPEAAEAAAAAAEAAPEAAAAEADGAVEVAAEGDAAPAEGEDSVQVSADNTVSGETGTTFTDANGVVYDIVVEPCMNGTYGGPEPIFGIMDLPCKPCGTYMTTMDQNPAYTYNETEPIVNVNFDACVTYAGYGKWGQGKLGVCGSVCRTPYRFLVSI